MKSTLLAVLVILGVIAVAPRVSTSNPLPANNAVQMSYDEDDDEEEWKCTCSVTCDGLKFSVSEKVCADDEDMKDAMQDAVDSCYREADPRCEDEPSCKCSCKTTGRDC
jgi:hypothetical protein